MNTNTLRYMGLAILMTVFTGMAGATGIGFFYSAGSGNVDYDLEYDHERDLSYDSDIVTRGFGFMLDTSVLRNRVFNYRLAVGFEEVEYDDYNVDLERLAVDHTFGFATVRTPFMRMWVGPQIRMSYTFGDNDFMDYEHIFGLGFGFNMGANFAISRIAVLSVDLGYRITGHYGHFEDHSYREDRDGNFVAGEGEAFFRMSFLFNMGEYWSR